MTKRFVKFASLFAVVAMFLGLMVTGCSEGDNTPADPTEGNTLLKATVGFADAVAAKGYDCPTDTEYLTMGVMNEDGLIETEDDYMAALYGAEDKDITIQGETVHENAWTENADGSVTLTMKLNYAEVALAEAQGIAIMAHEEDGTVIGMYTMPATFEEGKVTKCDFTAEDAPGFIAVDELTVKLGVVGVDDKDTMNVYLNEETKVNAQVYFYYDDQLVGSHAVKGFTLATESANVECSTENGTIKGTAISENNKVQVAYEYNVGGDPIEYYFNVNVVGLPIQLTCQSEELMPDFDNGDSVNIDSVKINGEEQLLEGYALKWNEGELYTLEDIVAGVGDEVEIHAVKVDGESGESFEGAIEKITVSHEFDANIMYVTTWTQLMTKTKVILDCSATEMTAEQFPLTIKWTYDDETQEDVTIEESTEEGTYEVGVVEVGTKVVIDGVSGSDGTIAAFEGGSFSYTIDETTTEDNVVSVVSWEK